MLITIIRSEIGKIRNFDQLFLGTSARIGPFNARLVHILSNMRYALMLVIKSGRDKLSRVQSDRVKSGRFKWVGLS